MMRPHPAHRIHCRPAAWLLPLLCLPLSSCDEKKAQEKTPPPPAAAGGAGVSTAPAQAPAPAPAPAPATGTAAAQPAAYDPSGITLDARQRRAAQWTLMEQVFKASDPKALSASAADVVISPASLVDTLQGIWWGTRGETAQELARLFQAQPGAAGAAASPPPPPLGAAVTLQAASSLWLDDQASPRPEYLALLKARGLGAVETLDWSKIPEGIDKVNRWAAGASGGRVEQLFAPDELKPPLALVLASVVFFKAGWAQPFEAAASQAGDFVLLDGSRRPATYLSATRELRHAATGSGASMVELPFADQIHRMVVLLPDQSGPEELAKLEAACPAGMAGWLAGLKPANVNLQLPKFNAGTKTNPRALLEAAGVKRIFSERDADFSGVSERGGLRVDTITHQAIVKIDEQGAEAVAATAAALAPKGLPSGEPVTFRADRPFLFFILGQNDDLLFAGRIAAPAAP